MKPCDPRALLARVRALLRRLAPPAPPPPPEGAALRGGIARFGGWRYDLAYRVLVDPGGARQTLTAAEHRLLAALLLAGGRTLSREALMPPVPDAGNAPDRRAVDVQVSRLRRRFAGGEEIVRTVRGRGYLLLPDVTFEG